MPCTTGVWKISVASCRQTLVACQNYLQNDVYTRIIGVWVDTERVSIPYSNMSCVETYACKVTAGSRDTNLARVLDEHHAARIPAKGLTMTGTTSVSVRGEVH